MTKKRRKNNNSLQSVFNWTNKCHNIMIQQQQCPALTRVSSQDLLHQLSVCQHNSI